MVTCVDGQQLRGFITTGQERARVIVILTQTVTIWVRYVEITFILRTALDRVK